MSDGLTTALKAAAYWKEHESKIGEATAIALRLEHTLDKALRARNRAAVPTADIIRGAILIELHEIFRAIPKRLLDARNAERANMLREIESAVSAVGRQRASGE